MEYAESLWARGISLDGRSRRGGPPALYLSYVNPSLAKLLQGETGILSDMLESLCTRILFTTCCSSLLFLSEQGGDGRYSCDMMLAQSGNDLSKFNSIQWLLGNCKRLQQSRCSSQDVSIRYHFPLGIPITMQIFGTSLG